MNKDRVEGKVKDVAGRIERQAGEWTDDPKKQSQGAAKQIEGKLQNAWGKAKDASKKTAAKGETHKSATDLDEGTAEDEARG